MVEKIKIGKKQRLIRANFQLLKIIQKIMITILKISPKILKTPCENIDPTASISEITLVIILPVGLLSKYEILNFNIFSNKSLLISFITNWAI